MASQHRKIKAVLYPNLLKNNEGKFKAQIISYQTLSIKDICKSLCSKPGIGANPDAIEYHVRLFLEEMSELLSDGYAINTGYFEAQLPSKVLSTSRMTSSMLTDIRLAINSLRVLL